MAFTDAYAAGAAAFCGGAGDVDLRLSHYLQETGFDARESTAGALGKGGGQGACRPALTGTGKLLDDGESNEGLQHRIAQREKQLALGKQTKGYVNYITAVPKESRDVSNPNHVTTPRANWDVSKRKFDAFVRLWRRVLHNWDEVDVELYQQQHLSGAAAGVAVGRPISLPRDGGAAVNSTDMNGTGGAGRDEHVNSQLKSQLSPQATPFMMPPQPQHAGGGSVGNGSFGDMMFGALGGEDGCVGLAAAGGLGSSSGGGGAGGGSGSGLHADAAPFLPHLRAIQHTHGHRGEDAFGGKVDPWAQAMDDGKAAAAAGGATANGLKRQAIRIPLPGATNRAAGGTSRTAAAEDVPPLVAADVPSAAGGRMPLLSTGSGGLPPHFTGLLGGAGSASGGSSVTSPPHSAHASPFAAAWGGAAAASPPTTYGHPPLGDLLGGHAAAAAPPKKPVGTDAAAAAIAAATAATTTSRRVAAQKQQVQGLGAADSALLDIIRGSWGDAAPAGPPPPTTVAPAAGPAALSLPAAVEHALRHRDPEGAYELLPHGRGGGGAAAPTASGLVLAPAAGEESRDPTNTSLGVAAVVVEPHRTSASPPRAALECWDCAVPCDAVSGTAVEELLGATCFTCRKAWDKSAAGAADHWHCCPRRHDAANPPCAFAICDTCAADARAGMPPPLEPMQAPADTGARAPVSPAITCWECDCACIRTSAAQAAGDVTAPVMACTVCGVAPSVASSPNSAAGAARGHAGAYNGNDDDDWHRCLMCFHPAVLCTFAVCGACAAAGPAAREVGAQLAAAARKGRREGAAVDTTTATAAATAADDAPQAAVVVVVPSTRGDRAAGGEKDQMAQKGIARADDDDDDDDDTSSSDDEMVLTAAGLAA